ncbi:hypothetical protein BX616_006659 [Lobosporangium transversale]|uniref:Uncharacterized protein n=1 Tax=Lobosporangium transversale TaxID=64571 RepID=A0A1Y2GRJ5_9FUNG|nr:hypothetical protein BCR41DRAFT_351368 [Lobosporangium transversale]KAF9915209.1 hypothetical protein BX616_006659 [Lobosporangium transversale]ORZ20155.1 hypothetical protein BCR41DRAFT_351368 [Lobosporangium transversale]|eukprot:XP_021882695.1 hypothetical protein BCR41DRAFT_351368 [Lobosporangium transversale]
MRYFEGTAFIVYGPSFVKDTISTQSQEQQISYCNHVHHVHAQHEHKQMKENANANANASETTFSLHSQQCPDFIATFRPRLSLMLQEQQGKEEEDKSLTELDDRGLNNNQAFQQGKEQQQRMRKGHNQDDQQREELTTDKMFILTGTPHPWGSYPHDISPPHGCIPPHLYYQVSIMEYDQSSNFSCRNSQNIQEERERGPRDLESNKGSTTDLNPGDRGGMFENKWIIPFVHRFGDGQDDAGGLTSSYQALEHSEDGVDDYGAFMEYRVATATAARSCSLYASTDVLISEQRVTEVIEREFFSQGSVEASSTTAATPTKIASITTTHELLEPLKRQLAYCYKSKQLPPFVVLQSDLKLILPDQ